MAPEPVSKLLHYIIQGHHPMICLTSIGFNYSRDSMQTKGGNFLTKHYLLGEPLALQKIPDKTSHETSHQEILGEVLLPAIYRGNGSCPLEMWSI